MDIGTVLKIESAPGQNGGNRQFDTLIDYERDLYAPLDLSTHVRLVEKYEGELLIREWKCTWRTLSSRYTSPHRDLAFLVDPDGIVISVMYESNEAVRWYETCTPCRLVEWMHTGRNDPLMRFDPHYLMAITRRWDAIRLSKEQPAHESARKYMIREVILYLNHYFVHIRASQRVEEAIVVRGRSTFSHSIKRIENVYPEANVAEIVGSKRRVLALKYWLEHVDHNARTESVVLPESTVASDDTGTSRSPTQWWEDVLTKGDPRILAPNEINMVHKLVIYELYMQWMASNRPDQTLEAENHFWRAMRQMLEFSVARPRAGTSRVHVVYFPPYPAAKIMFERYKRTL